MIKKILLVTTIPLIINTTPAIYDSVGKHNLHILDLITRDDKKIHDNNTRTSPEYTVELVEVGSSSQWTGFKLAGNQPSKGVNFGSTGGAFGYKDGNNYSPISMSFGVSAFLGSVSVGFGTMEKAGVGGYTINAPSNRFVKLYVNKKVRVITYKRYKVYKINGYKESYGYVNGSSNVESLEFKVE